MLKNISQKWMTPVVVMVLGTVISSYVVYRFSLDSEMMKSIHLITDRLERLDARAVQHEDELRDHNQRISKNTASVEFLKENK